jgi:hypothetical protein
MKLLLICTFLHSSVPLSLGPEYFRRHFAREHHESVFIHCGEKPSLTPIETKGKIRP